MDNKTLNCLTYGVFLVSTVYEGQMNGCITDTCIQVASDPVRVVFSLMNTNYTCELVKRSQKVSVSILDKDISFDTIKAFGLRSGRDVDKFIGLDMPKDKNGIPYMNLNSCAVISVEVVEQINLGSHTLFIGEVVDAIKLEETEPLTYAWYQEKIKPKIEASVNKESETRGKQIIGWRCTICGYIYEGNELAMDFDCPTCGHGPEDFEPIYG